MNRFTIDDIGKPVCVSRGGVDCHGVLGAISGRDRTCLVRLPLSELIIGWIPWDDARVILENEEAA